MTRLKNITDGSTIARRESLRAARTILLACKNAGGTGLNGVWEYLREQLDAEVSR